MASPFRKNDSAVVAVPVPFSAPRPLTAAASQIKIGDANEAEQFRKRRTSSASVWQAEAWEYYDAIGEIKYSFSLISSILSRIRLYPAVVENVSETPVALANSDTIDPALASAAERALARLDSAYGGQAGLLRDAALNILVSGECYLVQIPARPGSGLDESWDIRSVDELQVDSYGSYKIIPRRDLISNGMQNANQAGTVTLPERAFVGRIWRAHPRFSEEPDSSMRSLLDLCLAEGTLIYTPTGAKPIESLSAGDLVYSRDPKDGALISVPASKVWSTGEKPVFRVNARGRSIRATGNHPVLVLRDTNLLKGKGYAANYELVYVRVDELARGDKLVSFEGAKQSGPETMQTLPSGIQIDSDVAWFIGQVAGDGHMQKGKYHSSYMGVSDYNPVVRKRLEEIALRYWPGVRFSHQGGNFRAISKSLCTDLRSLGLGVYSYQKVVPELIWASSKEVQKGFLEGYHCADGSGGVKGPNYHAYSSTSLPLVSGVRAMHILHGDRVSAITSSERPPLHINGGKLIEHPRDLHKFEMYGSDSNRRGDLFMRRSKSARNLIPLDSPFTLSSVKSVVEDGVATVWDLSVPDTSNFIADGLVVHNCDELLLLNRTFRATARSRLNAGALYLPDGLSVAASADVEAPYDEEGEYQGPTQEESEDDFEENLIEAMTTPIKDESSASAVVPLLIRGPSELGEKIKQFKFERSFDDNLIKRADRVLDRILQGLDVPKDIITGLANVRYTNAQTIDDSLYKAHVEPLVILLADAFTQVYLRPYLISIGYTQAEVERVVVWYDPSSIATRTDRAADADSGYEKNAISADTWRRAHGFSDADAPTPTEFAIKLLTTHGALSPELSEAILTAVAPEIMGAAKSAAQASSVAPVPTEVNTVLQGGQPIPADPTAENTPGAPGTTPADDSATSPLQPDSGNPQEDAGLGEDSTIPPDSETPAQPGQDAPPILLT